MKTPSLKPFARAILFCAVLLAVLMGLAKVMDMAASKDLREKGRWIMSHHDQKYDFVILGPSRSYLGIDVGVLENKLHQKGINLSLEGTTFPEQYMALALFLERNEVDHVILDVSYASFDNGSFKSPFSAYPYLPRIQHRTIFTNLVANFGWRAYAWKYVPFFKNAEFNSKIGILPVYTWIKSTRSKAVAKAEFDQHGSRLMQRPFEGDSTLWTNVSWQIQPLPKDYFLQILDLAKRKNIKLTLIMSPELNAWTEKQVNRAEILGIYEQAARERNLTLLRYEDHELSRNRKFYLDKNHLNKAGALLFSEQLANDLKRTPN